MLSLLLPPSLVGLIAGVLLSASILAAFTAFIPFMLLKLLVPLAPFRRACTEVLFAIAQQWTAFNHVIYRLLYPVAWEIDLRGELDPSRSYLLVCNHQSIIDILLVFDQFSRRTPPPCFFLKRELLWVPVIGLACWGMDFPFMKRHSRAELERNPQLKDEDLRTTRAFCERFRDEPVTVVNFVEGTRFSEAKRAAQPSPHRHLLRPKSAGLAFTLAAMGEQFDGVIDVTIAYRPSRFPIAWSFLIGEQATLAMHIDVRLVPADLIGGDYQGDAVFRERFQGWVNTLWTQKDGRLDNMIGRRPAAAPRPRMT
ncbi:MAG TPA: acyltransferase [Verrucomicrobiae bacterium]|nr:acyltransferase [Verrucomicrobiae bacterium]